MIRSLPFIAGADPNGCRSNRARDLHGRTVPRTIAVPRAVISHQIGAVIYLDHLRLVKFPILNITLYGTDHFDLSTAVISLTFVVGDEVW